MHANVTLKLLSAPLNSHNLFDVEAKHLGHWGSLNTFNAAIRKGPIEMFSLELSGTVGQWAISL